MLMLTSLFIGCTPRSLLGRVKNGFARPDLVLDAQTLPRAIAAYAEADVVRALPGLPARDESDLYLSVLALCDDNVEHTMELPQDPACPHEGTITHHYLCAESGRIQLEWIYDGVKRACDGINYDGEVAIEVNATDYGHSVIEAVDLETGGRRLRRASFVRQSGPEYGSHFLLVYDGAARAVIGWYDTPLGRDFSCFSGRDAKHSFKGSYTDATKMALYVPAVENDRAFYRLQVPEEAVLDEACFAKPLIEPCALASDVCE